MRANPTEAERKLWDMLRAKRFLQYKFRRQQIIVPYIVDFVCFEKRLIVEVDGSQHADNRYDERRDTFLKAQRFEVRRFWNNDILANSTSVAEAIYDALTGASHA